MSARKAEAVVIGGGAAGMMAALTAAQRGKNVILLEHEKFCGKKLRITGKGRCNVCNDCDVRTFLKNVPGNAKFLSSALNRFSPADTMAFFESLGVPLKTERGNRVFPVSDNAHDVARALEAAMKRAGVKLVLSAAMLLRHSFGMEEEAAAVESAVGEVLASKVRTPDIAEPGVAAVSTSEMGECVLSAL